MPRITLTLEPDLYDQVLLHKPKRQALSAFCADLIEQQALGLDSASKLPAYRVGAGTHESRVCEAPTAIEADLGRSASSALDASSDEQLAVEVLDSQIFTQGFEPKKTGFLGIRDEIDDLVDELLVTPRERGTNPKAKGSNPRALGTNARALGINPKAAKDPYTKRTLNADQVPSDLLDCQQLLPEFWAVKKGTRSGKVWNRVCNKLRQWSSDQRREALELAIASGWGDVFEPPSAKAAQGNTGGYVDSISRDRQVRERFLSMFSTDEESA